jgi:hypothetical protein
MPTVGDYVTFGDADVVLQIGADIDNTYTVTLPSNLNRNSTAIMTLQMEAESPNNLRWNMAVNGTTLRTFTHNTDRFGTIQEVFSGSPLNVGANTVTVTVLSGQGRLRVSDFALHHQVDV